jgi:hypothetical protein
MDFTTSKPNTNADYGIWVQYSNSGSVHDFKNNAVTLRRGGNSNSLRYALFFSGLLCQSANQQQQPVFC